MVNERGSSTWVCGFLAALIGCATSQPGPPVQTSVARPPEATPPLPPPVPRPSRSGEVADIPGPDALVGLCQALRDERTIDFQGNAVEQARASAAHAERRRAAQASSYAAMIPAAGFWFRTYQLGERRLVLDTDRGFVLGDGAEIFARSQDPAPGFVLPAELAERLLAERAAGRLALRLVFRPAASELREDGCMWLGGGRVVKMEIEIVASALLGPDGAVAARADTGEYGDPNAGLPVRSPKVSVHKPRGADGKDLPAQVAESFAPLSTAALPCYHSVLRVRPALRGMLVLALRIGAVGKVEEARIEMSSLADDAVSACVVAAVRKASLPGLGPGQRFSVPLEFASADEQ